MKRLVYFSTLIVSLYSCDTKNNAESSSFTNNLENFSLTADTVQVDVGEELFNPGGYYLRDYSEDVSKGYFFYPENEIHVIDLNNLKLLERHILEEDGPDAIPKYLNDMQALPDEEIFFANYAQTGVYKISGKKVDGYKLQPEDIEGIPNDAGYSLTNSIHISPDKTTLLSLPNTFGEPIEGLAIINTQEMSGKIIDLPALELTNNFQTVFREGNGAMSGGDFQKLQFLNGKFLIYSGATSDTYSYDWKSDSLHLYTFPHQLVPVSKTGKITKNMDFRESYYAANRELKKQITFGEFLWDESKESYFRFADMNAQFNDEGMLVKSDMYLFSYDKEMNLTGETKMEGFKYMPYNGFIKNGKLYVPWVQDENPAFIVYTLNY